MAINMSTEAWFPDDAVIKLEKKGSYTVQTVTTKVTNFNDGGGDKTTESIAHFGGAFLVIKKPQEDFTVEFDVDIVDSRWAEIISGDTVEVTGSFMLVRSGGNQNPYKVKVEWFSPDTNEAYKKIWYNSYGVTLNSESAADDRLTGTMSFAIAPTSNVGSSQYIEMETVDKTATGVGSSATGSYGYWERYYDTLFGYGVGSMI